VQVIYGVDFAVDEGGVTALLAQRRGQDDDPAAISAMIRREGEIDFRGAPMAARTTEDVASSGSRTCRTGAARSPT